MVNKRTATIDDINYIYTRARKEDVEEIFSIARVNLKDALIQSFYASPDCIVGETDGKVFCIVGCVPDNFGASLWMLFTSDIQYLPMSFFKISRKVVKEWLDKYGNLHNYTQKGNVFILKWLKWLDFTIEPFSLLGIDNIEVHKFWKER